MIKTSSVQKYITQVADDPTCYVVANRTEAVLYLEGNNNKFHFCARLSNEDGKLHESALVSDRQGRGISSAGGGSIHHGLGSKTSHHELLAKKFASRISVALDKMLEKKVCREFVLVAEPHFLGLLRDALSTNTRRVVVREVGHEYAQGSDDEIHTKIMKSIAAG
jgi:protein required for attachment to host cells